MVSSMSEEPATFDTSDDLQALGLSLPESSELGPANSDLANKLIWARKMLERMDQDRNEQNKVWKKRIASAKKTFKHLYEEPLKRWAKDQLALQKGKSKTLTLISGSLSFRNTKQRVKVLDGAEQSLIEHILSNQVHGRDGRGASVLRVGRGRGKLQCQVRYRLWW
jgi:hypothetical protein